ncbi:MAG TPA: hypothetical protein VHD56_16255 [Tepidisphaeraceae bacterium]|nr:hypothetical protein [Tepidisphaeraceae bacterium]
MTNSPVQIEYESAVVLPTDRILRCIVGWAAIVYGGTNVILNGLRVALANGWIASPASTSWYFGSTLQKEIILIYAAARTMLLVGGIRLLRRLPHSISLLRIGAAGSILMLVIDTAITVHANLSIVSLWSTLGETAFRLIAGLQSLYFPLLLLALTLPPLSRRMA